MSCEIGDQTNQLKFRFHDIENQELTNIFFEFSKFRNPWSAITVQSIRINAFRDKDCLVGPESSRQTPPVTFWPKYLESKNVLITSTSNVLGDSSPNLNMTITWTPTVTVSKTGRGMIQVSIPLWYDVANKNNMMFNE